MSSDQTVAAKKDVPKREIFAWCFYDFANSSFTTVIVTAVYVLYFRKVVVPDGAKSDLFWGLALSIAMLFVAVSSPILGAVADYSGAKKKFLIGYALTCVVFTALLYFVGPGMIFWGIALFVVANIGFAGGNVFYNAFLPEIASRENMGRISGLGWAVGYLGGMLCLAAVYPLAKRGGEAVRLSFPLTALFFFVFALPTFVLLKERARPRPLPEGQGYLGMGFAQLVSTLKQVGRYRELAKFLFIFLVYNDAVTTVIAFTAPFAQQSLAFKQVEILKLLIVVNIAAAPGALVFGFVADRFGSKRTIMVTLAMWTAICTATAFTTTRTQFWIVAMCAGLAIGAVQSVSRTLVGLFSPRSKSAEFFGFQAVCGKFAAMLGPLLFGIVSWGTGSQRIAVGLVAGIFALSLVALWRLVDEQAGIDAARDDEAGEEVTV